MNRRADYRSFIACAVAYAITIQAALLGFVAVSVAGTVSAGAIWCVDQGNGSVPAVPMHGADASCCVAAGCSGFSGIFPDRIFVEPAGTSVASAETAVVVEDFRAWPSERPKSSRAPPV
jgi:hypothetical protein